ncbi:MAG TPA: hypothetical protein VFZ70_00780 [Euzebyales bacterium]
MAHELDRWKPALINGGSGLAVIALGWMVEGRLTWPIMGAAVVALGWGWWVSPLRNARPHVPHADAAATAGPYGPVVYWRPGCSYCLKLWRALDRDERDRVTWVNVMADRDASVYVRRFHDGRMVTPTAVMGTGRQIEATASQIRARVARRRGRPSADPGRDR